jgi:hypothetical protein
LSEVGRMWGASRAVHTASDRVADATSVVSTDASNSTITGFDLLLEVCVCAASRREGGGAGAKVGRNFGLCGV